MGRDIIRLNFSQHGPRGRVDGGRCADGARPYLTVTIRPHYARPHLPKKYAVVLLTWVFIRRRINVRYVWDCARPDATMLPQTPARWFPNASTVRVSLRCLCTMLDPEHVNVYECTGDATPATPMPTIRHRRLRALTKAIVLQVCASRI